MKYNFGDANKALGEVFTTMRWELEVSNIPAIGGFSSNMLIRCDEVSGLPSPKVGVIDAVVQGHHLYFTGRVDGRNGQLSLTFHEGTDAEVLQYWSKYCLQASSIEGFYTKGVQTASTADLQFDVTLHIKNPQEDIDVATLMCNRCVAGDFNIAISSLNGAETDGQVKPSISIYFGDAHWLFGDKATTW